MPTGTVAWPRKCATTRRATDAAYKAEKERCDAMSGDAEDKCQADVKAKFGE